MSNIFGSNNFEIEYGWLSLITYEEYLCWWWLESVSPSQPQSTLSFWAGVETSETETRSEQGEQWVVETSVHCWDESQHCSVSPRRAPAHCSTSCLQSQLPAIIHTTQCDAVWSGTGRLNSSQPYFLIPQIIATTQKFKMQIRPISWQRSHTLSNLSKV